MRKIGVLPLMFLFLITGFDSIYAQRNWVSKSAKIFNVPNSPAKIEISRNKRYIRLINESSLNIIGFEFGCIRKEGKVLSITNSFVPKIIDLQSINIQKNYSFVFGSGLSGLASCSKVHELLTITKVEFEDKTVWEFKE
jgi:hypothetical protein